MTTKHKGRGVIYYPQSNNKLEDQAVLRLSQMLAKTLSDEDALQVSILFPSWEVGVPYKEGERIQHGQNNLYLVCANHIATEDASPSIEGTLYQMIQPTL